jgi:hypothetical protein
MHRAAYHFVHALGVPSMTKIKRKVSQREGEVENTGEPDDNGNDDNDEADIDVSLAIEADADDPEAMAAITTVDYDPGDTLGKLMAFVNQLRMSSEVTREYLFRTCIMQNVKPIELLLWIRTRWGSLTHCLESTLSIQKVCYCFYCLLRDTDVYTRLSTIFVSPQIQTMISHLSKTSLGLTIDSHHQSGILLGLSMIV